MNLPGEAGLTWNLRQSCAPPRTAKGRSRLTLLNASVKTKVSAAIANLCCSRTAHWLENGAACPEPDWRIVESKTLERRTVTFLFRSLRLALQFHKLDKRPPPLGSNIMKFDEQFFQSLLSAAFTIQEYNGCRELSGCTMAHTADIPKPSNESPNISTQTPEAIRSEEFGIGRLDNHNGSGYGTMEQSDQPTPNVYLDLLNSIGAEDAEVAEKTVSTTKEAAKATGPPAEHPTCNLVGNVLRILEAEEGGDKEDGDGLSASADEKETTEIHEKDQGAGQASQPSNIEVLAVTVTDSQIDDHQLRLALQQVLQATRATTAAIALGNGGKLRCRDSVGESASEIRTLIDGGSGFAAACASKGAMQFCPNTMLDSRTDAQACHKLGARAVIFMPLFREDQTLGLIAAFSRRPYAFGVRELQALQDLADEFAVNLQIVAVPRSDSNPLTRRF
jgi:GAF domain